MSPLAAVVFDFDGIIIDSETSEFESHRRIFERCGVSLTTEEWCDQIGMWTEGHDERWFRELCARSSNAPDQAAYHAEKQRIFDEVVPDGPMRGIRELLTELAGAGIPAAIASSSSGVVGRTCDRAARPARALRRDRDRRRCRAPQAGPGRLPGGRAPARRGSGALDRPRGLRPGHRGGARRRHEDDCDPPLADRTARPGPGRPAGRARRRVDAGAIAGWNGCCHGYA